MRITRLARFQKARQLIERFALDAQRHQHRAQLQIGDLAREHGREQRACVVAVKVTRGVLAAAAAAAAFGLERADALIGHPESQAGLANLAVYATLFDADDCVASDALNHASIIDGCRLSRAAIKVFQHKDVADCERILKETANWKGKKLLITDGVFSMDGYVAQLDRICDLADQYDAMVMVDECHATGFIGKTGRGTIELKNVMGRVDIITGTLGKAFGVMGGFLPVPGQTIYGASKAALASMTRTWALELASRGITVNTVAPVNSVITEVVQRALVRATDIHAGLFAHGFEALELAEF